MNLREIEEDGIRHYERIGALNGEQADGEPDRCQHCLEMYDADEEQCPCEPPESVFDEWDFREDR